MNDRKYHEAFTADAYFWPTNLFCRCCGTRLKVYYAEERLHAVKCGYCESITLVKADNPTMAARHIGDYERGADNEQREQIEEMTVEFAKINCNPKGCYCCNLCDEYGSLELNCEDYLSYRKMAETFYNAGYRKQSEGEWIVTDADSGSFGEYAPFIEFKCPKCESGYGLESGQYDWQYGEPIPWVACPLCGAKMKGGAEG